MKTEQVADKLLHDNSRYQRWRHIKDVTMRYVMMLGGCSVIFTITLIAFYLLYVVIPMFKSAEVELVASYELPGSSATTSLAYAMEEQREVALRIDDSGKAIFFSTVDGQLRNTIDLGLANTAITASATGDPTQNIIGLGLADGRVLIVQHYYEVSFPNDVRLITPKIAFPLGEEPIQVAAAGDAITQISVQYDGQQATVVTHSDSGTVKLITFSREESLLSDALTITQEESIIPISASGIIRLTVDVDQRELYIADTNGYIYFFDINDKTAPRLVQKGKVVADGVSITEVQFLTGGISILVGDSSGQIAQWFPVADSNNNYTLQKVRTFDKQQAPIRFIAAEHSRKGFAAIDAKGIMGLYYTSAHRNVLLEQVIDSTPKGLVLSPRHNAALIENAQGQLQFFHITNEHPEVSWQSIWGKVWYESRSQPEYIWQSSSASSDFEPKFSLTPLVYGTFKSVFYAMLFAIPLAILGAVYTGYFMDPAMRRFTKPTIEIMEALPTVILGFLAGLWLAPFVEVHLPGVFLMLLIVPLSVIAAAAVWYYLPGHIKNSVPDGWQAALLIPVVIVAIAVAITLSAPIERLFFNGNLPLWLTQELGITYDQRNAVVVGFAMGFAVIPTIFSISEDAIYNVPKHLTTGSLALGATTWQTMIKVVLLTASPGIFSAVMIGLGRAVGETMIVVMATGNTPIMDMNFFEGFRALSANIAVEMPETEVNSTHYRILFLGALVLFIVTFCFNTVAELVRQQLRIKYSSL